GTRAAAPRGHPRSRVHPGRQAPRDLPLRRAPHCPTTVAHHPAPAGDRWSDMTGPGEEPSVPADAPAPGELLVPSGGGRSWVRRLLLWVIVVVATIGVARLIGRIEWAAVWQAMGHLTWWQPFVLLALLAVRQVANAAPLAFYIPGVNLYRATVNDLGAATMAAFAPPPGAMVLRDRQEVVA